jgi:hypothetical protein
MKKPWPHPEQILVALFDGTCRLAIILRDPRVAPPTGKLAVSAAGERTKRLATPKIFFEISRKTAGIALMRHRSMTYLLSAGPYWAQPEGGSIHRKQR